jgi:hypothetical protein
MENAEKNLTAKIGRKPTKGEVKNYAKTRKFGKAGNAFVDMLLEKNQEKAFQKALKLKQAEAKKMEAKAEKIAVKEASKVSKEEKKMINKTMKKELRIAERNAKKDAKAAAKEAASVQFQMAEAAARNNLSRVLGKAPQIANIKRLAGIRTSGANLSVNDYMRVKQHAKTLKAKNSLDKFFKENVRNIAPEIDVCAQCDMKRFLESENH